MAERLEVDELDLDLIAALREAPRAPINALAEALGSSASTLGRRLRRLQSDRLLRIIGQLDWRLFSDTHPHHVWINTAPGQPEHVARRLSRLPAMRYVAVTTGRSDVHCTVHPMRRDAAKDLLTRQIPAVEGVVATQSDLVLHAFGRADAWYPHRIGADRRTALAAHRTGHDEVVTPDGFTDHERRAATLLRADARLPSGALARELRISQSSAHRLLNGLLRRRIVRPRVEVEPALLGFGIEAVVSLSTEPGAARTIGEALGEHPSARSVCLVAGNATVTHQGVFAGEDELAEFLSGDLAELPGIRSVEVSVVLDVLRRYWINRDGVRIGGDGCVFPEDP